MKRDDVRQWRRPGAEFGGTQTNFSRPKISEWRFFGKNFHFQVTNLWWPFFSHRPGFSQIFRIFTMLNVVYDPFLTRKTPFFTLFILSHAFDNTTSQNIGGHQCMGRPPASNFWGTVPQSPSRSPPLVYGVIVRSLSSSFRGKKFDKYLTSKCNFGNWYYFGAGLYIRIIPHRWINWLFISI